MRIVVATPTARYWGPQVECIAEAMRCHGHEAIAVTNRSINQFQGLTSDVLFCIGDVHNPKPFLDAVRAPTRLLFLIESLPTQNEADDFTRLKLKLIRQYVHEFEHVFVHTSRSVPTLQAIGLRRVETLVWPHFPSIYRPVPTVGKDFDVLFVGLASSYRVEVLQRVARKFQVTVRENFFHSNCADLYSRAKVVLNIHCTPLRNLECRVIEALGCGAFLLTEALDPDDVLLNRQHLVVFNAENVLELLDHYLQHETDRDRIARGGHTEVQNYRIEKQVERILDVAKELHGLRSRST
jgi:spore maturation protein CgeB